MKHSTNERAERIVGKRECKGIPIDQPCELGYTCPVCENKKIVDYRGNFDERLWWSEYEGFLWCSVCNKDYPSFLCMQDIDKATELFLDFLEYKLTKDDQNNRQRNYDR